MERVQLTKRAARYKFETGQYVLVDTPFTGLRRGVVHAKGNQPGPNCIYWVALKARIGWTVPQVFQESVLQAAP